jgi:hypothetical protein
VYKVPHIIKVPVAIIIFNRSDLVKILLEQLSKFNLSKLYIIMDGPRQDNVNDVKERKAILDLINDIDFAQSIDYQIADNNLGCTQRVVSGLNYVFEREESAIILEDDCIPSDTFFEFCQLMLTKYRNDDRVGIISGSNLVETSNKNNSYHFSKYSNIWGWASWRRVWTQYDVELNKLDKEVMEKIKGRFNNKNEYKYWKAVFEQTKEKLIKTWDYQLWFSLWINGQISIVPSVNQIENLGFGHSNATHTAGPHPAKDIKKGNLKFPLIDPDVMLPDTILDNKILETLYQFPSIPFRIKNKLLKLIGYK